jgi:hypothetical protein
VATPWAQLEAWLLFPAVMAATAAGLGLLIDRIVRVRVPDALLIPLGLCGSIVVLMPVYKVGLTAPFAVAVLVILAVLGFVLGIDRRRVLGGWAGIGALVVFAVYMAPVVLTGNWTWEGYNFVNDTAFQLILADWLQHHGIPYTAQPRTTTSQVVEIYLETAYPLGSHAHWATLSALTRAPLEVVYQSYISGLVATMSMALFSLGRRVGLSGRSAAFAAVVASCAALTFNYAAQGNIKEMAMVATLAISIAVGAELLGSERPLGLVVCLAIVIAASLSVYYAAAVPYVGVVVVLLAVAAAWLSPAVARRRLAFAAAAGAVVLVVASAPALAGIRTSRMVLSGTLASTTPTGNDLAQLKRPLPPLEGTGIWLTGDYRDPVLGTLKHGFTQLGIGLILVLCLVGVFVALRRRRELLGALLLLAAGVIVYVVVSPRTSPYADGKLLALMAPGVLLFALVSALAATGRLRPVALAAASLIGVLTFASVALAYHQVKLAPAGRMADLDEIDDHYAGTPQLTLLSEFEEYGKYFLRKTRVNDSPEAITESFTVLRGGGPAPGQSVDSDDIDLDYLERFPRLVVRRGPGTSRPPANYALQFRTADYDVYAQRQGTSVQGTFPLNSTYLAQAEPNCSDLESFVDHRQAGTRVLAASTPETESLELPTLKTLPPGWHPDPERPGQVLLTTPGIVRGELSVAGGSYQAWIQGSFGRPMKLRIDGREVGSAQGIDTPKAWLRAGGLVKLAPGRHTIEIERPSGGLGPGDGARSDLGAFALVAPGEDHIQEVAPDQVRTQLCDKSWDWIELVG